jgi:hypothetical protein
MVVTLTHTRKSHDPTRPEIRQSDLEADLPNAVAEQRIDNGGCFEATGNDRGFELAYHSDGRLSMKRPRKHYTAVKKVGNRRCLFVERAPVSTYATGTAMQVQ